jgi:hypothetical protein
MAASGLSERLLFVVVVSLSLFSMALGNVSMHCMVEI